MSEVRRRFLEVSSVKFLSHFPLSPLLYSAALSRHQHKMSGCYNEMCQIFAKYALIY